MREALIVSTARTSLAKSQRGTFNITHPITLAGHVIDHAIRRAGVEHEVIEDVLMGTGYPEGASGSNIARNAAIKAGCPVTTAGATINRYCSSGLQSIAMAAGRIVNESVDVMVAGGVESISLVQLGGHVNKFGSTEPALHAARPALWMSMLETAEIVAERYGVSRESQDQFALLSQQRTAAAQAAGRFADEIVPLTTRWQKLDKKTGVNEVLEVTADRDECNRPETTLAALAALRGGFGI